MPRVSTYSRFHLSISVEKCGIRDSLSLSRSFVVSPRHVPARRDGRGAESSDASFGNSWRVGMRTRGAIESFLLAPAARGRRGWRALFRRVPASWRSRKNPLPFPLEGEKLDLDSFDCCSSFMRIYNFFELSFLLSHSVCHCFIYPVACIVSYYKFIGIESRYLSGHIMIIFCCYVESG